MVARARLEVEVVKAIRAPVPTAFLRGLLQRAAHVPEVEARLPAGRATIAVRLTSDDELRRLNRDFAGHDSVTDVLSFRGSDEHLGDLAISWPMVLRQAEEFGESDQTELSLLGVHGLLHLLGWDHESAAEREEMTRITVAALALSGVELPPGRL
ncbi:MAG TPA: rRNA maturation RNase YbeY [Candidatus Dormibacteraeota bacterium]|nr:rRNA maturation RNase YbeY [Candidatus Dormibacteraeota bacterium]